VNISASVVQIALTKGTWYVLPRGKKEKKREKGGHAMGGIILIIISLFSCPLEFTSRLQ